MREPSEGEKVVESAWKKRPPLVNHRSPIDQDGEATSGRRLSESNDGVSGDEGRGQESEEDEDTEQWRRERGGHRAMARRRVAVALLDGIFTEDVTAVIVRWM